MYDNKINLVDQLQQEINKFKDGQECPSYGLSNNIAGRLFRK